MLSETPHDHSQFPFVIRVVESEPTMVVELSCAKCGTKLAMGSEHATLDISSGLVMVWDRPI